MKIVYMSQVRSTVVRIQIGEGKKPSSTLYKEWVSQKGLMGNHSKNMPNAVCHKVLTTNFSYFISHTVKDKKVHTCYESYLTTNELAII